MLDDPLARLPAPLPSWSNGQAVARLLFDNSDWMFGTEEVEEGRGRKGKAEAGGGAEEMERGRGNAGMLGRRR